MVYQNKVNINIIYFENLVENLKKIECLRDMNFNNFPHINKLNELYNENLLDDEVKEYIYNTFKIDFDYFHYNK